MRAYDPQTRKNNREVGRLKRSRLRQWINKTIFGSNEGIWELPIPAGSAGSQIMLFETIERLVE